MTPQEIVDAYVATGARCLDALKEQYAGTDRPTVFTGLWLVPRDGGEPVRSGYLEGLGHFKLHGIGCRFELDSGELVDVDWDDAGRTVFNAWRLLIFADSLGVTNHDEASLRRAASESPTVATLPGGRFTWCDKKFDIARVEAPTDVYLVRKASKDARQHRTRLIGRSVGVLQQRAEAGRWMWLSAALPLWVLAGWFYWRNATTPEELGRLFRGFSPEAAPPFAYFAAGFCVVVAVLTANMTAVQAGLLPLWWVRRRTNGSIVMLAFLPVPRFRVVSNSPLVARVSVGVADTNANHLGMPNHVWKLEIGGKSLSAHLPRPLTMRDIEHLRSRLRLVGIEPVVRQEPQRQRASKRR